MIRTALTALASLVLIGCTTTNGDHARSARVLTPDGIRFTQEDVAQAAEYPGVPVEIEEKDDYAVGVTWEVDADGDVIFRLGTKRLAVVKAPPDWEPAGWGRFMAPGQIGAYYWADTRWRTPRRREVSLTLRYFGPDDLFVDLNGRPSKAPVGSTLWIDAGPSLRVATLRAANRQPD